MLNMTKIFSFNTELDKVTGVQKVLVDIHNGIKQNYNAKIIGTIDYTKVNTNNKICREEYIKLRNPFIFRKSIVFIHERKLTTIFYFLNFFLRLHAKVVYIHHNEFNSGRKFTFLPKNIISISDSGTNNLEEYFKVPKENITKIHNGISDTAQTNNTRMYGQDKVIKVLYAARINEVKRQVTIVRQLKDKLSKDVVILFAGTGPLHDELKLEVGNNPQFKILGFIKDIPALIKECDYMLLYSTNEGLPITLIEATMCGTPLITNDVGGNLEIAVPDKNAFSVSDWDHLTEILNNLPNVSCVKYNEMCKESRRIYEEKFQYERMIEKYKYFIENLMPKINKDNK